MKYYLLTDDTIELLKEKLNKCDNIDDIINIIHQKQVPLNQSSFNYQIRNNYLNNKKLLNPNLEIYHSLYNK